MRTHEAPPSHVGRLFLNPGKTDPFPVSAECIPKKVDVQWIKLFDADQIQVISANLHETL
jgi:hypothetical protein